MNLIAIGINHKTAPTAIREKIYFSPEKTTTILQSLVKDNLANEAVLLSTCNRTELYCTAESPAPIVSKLMRQSDFEPALFDQCSYIHQGANAVAHVMRVASGLDSMVLGEPEILGQLKGAVKLAESEGTCQRQLRYFFRHVVSAAKTIRSTTTLGHKPLSFAYAITFLAKRIFADLTQLNVLFVGAGETISQVAKHFYKQKVHQIWMSNRTLSKAKQLGEGIGAVAVEFSQLSHYLQNADIVVSATASSLPIIGKGAIESALKFRKHRPMLIIDLAVPRDVEAEIETLEDVYLYTLDHLQTIVSENFSDRLEAAKEAEKIVEIETARFMRNLRSLQAVDTIKTFRTKIDAIYQDELNWSLKKLQAGFLPEEVLLQMGKRLANKFMHHPSVKLREASMQGQFEVFTHMHTLFNLSDEL